MPREALCYEILIASPSDVMPERQIIAECIEDWNAAHSRVTKTILQPRRWELDVYPEMGDRPQEVINKQIVDHADLIFGVFWQRVGMSTGKAQSGTIEEIERSVTAERPVFLYFSQSPVPMNHDAAQLAAVSEYKSRVRKQGVAFDFSGVHEFRRMVSRHLAAKMSELLSTSETDSIQPKIGTPSRKDRSPSEDTVSGPKIRKLRKALMSPNYRWRTIERLASAIASSEDEVCSLLLNMDDVRLSWSASGNQIAGLRSRVGD